MQRYFISSSQIQESYAFITGQDHHHIKNVMRSRIGDEITIVDESGNGFLAKISEITNQLIKVDLINRLDSNIKQSKITIAQALIKKDRFEWFLEKATELGVYSIIPTLFEYSIIKIDEENESKKIQRYQTIVKEASEQSKRFVVPKIQNVMKLSQLPFEQYDKVLICYEGASSDDFIMSIVQELNSSMSILVIIGPEGGISPKELAILQSKKGVICSIGNRILRSETAGLLVLSVVNSIWEC